MKGEVGRDHSFEATSPTTRMEAPLVKDVKRNRHARRGLVGKILICSQIRAQ